MANEDKGSKSGQQQPESERRFNQQQYERLLRCSDKKDMTEWNDWVNKHKSEDILLEGVDLSKQYLEGALLWGAHLKHAKLSLANLKGANLSWAHLEHAELIGTRLENAHLLYTNLKNAILSEAHLENATLHWAYLEGVECIGTHLEGSSLHTVTVNGSTLLQECEVDRYTDFRLVSLDIARIDPATKQLLEYNIRRINWEDWYKEHKRQKWLVRPFWLMSDYGRSTGRIALTFFILAFVFAAIYYVCGMLNPPGIVSSLFEGKEGLVPVWLVPLRTIYFSIVTMTTLGFGDMHANCQSLLGHLLLTVQVIMGYVLLGALVTRFAVLFTAGGPAGKFSPTKTKEKGEGEKNRA